MNNFDVLVWVLETTKVECEIKFNVAARTQKIIFEDENGSGKFALVFSSGNFKWGEWTPAIVEPREEEIK